MSPCNIILKLYLIYIKRKGFFQVFIGWMLIYTPKTQEKPITDALSAWQLSFSNVSMLTFAEMAESILALLVLFNNLAIRICLVNRNMTSALHGLSSV